MSIHMKYSVDQRRVVLLVSHRFILLRLLFVSFLCIYTLIYTVDTIGIVNEP